VDFRIEYTYNTLSNVGCIIGLTVTETPAGISATPLRYSHPVVGRARAHGRAACYHIARVCVPLDAAVTRVTCTCPAGRGPARRGPARRGCHSCDVNYDVLRVHYVIQHTYNIDERGCSLRCIPSALYTNIIRTTHSDSPRTSNMRQYIGCTQEGVNPIFDALINRHTCLFGCCGGQPTYMAKYD